jgi:nucleotide-binding universal stress UspA family protein
MSFAVLIVAWVGVNLFFAALSSFLASRWGRDPFGWLFLGSALGPIAFFILLVTRWDDRRRVGPVIAGQGSRTGVRAGPAVLAAVDGSAPSARAVQHVIDEFGPRVSEVLVLGVLHMERADGLAADPASPRRRDLEEDIQRHVGAACATLRAAGLSCKPVVRFGDPATEILKQANESACDLIVLGRRGLGGAAKALLGSVSDNVAREAPCPVTLVS